MQFCSKCLFVLVIFGSIIANYAVVYEKAKTYNQNSESKVGRTKSKASTTSMDQDEDLKLDIDTRNQGSGQATNEIPGIGKKEIVSDTEVQKEVFEDAIIPKDGKEKENDSKLDSSKVNIPVNPILLSLYSSACQRDINKKSNLYPFEKKSNKPLDEYDNGPEAVSKDNENSKIDKDELNIVKDALNKEDLAILSDDYTDLEVEEMKTEVDEDYYHLFTPGLPDCSEKARYPLLIVSTLDGRISGINYESGNIMWSHETGADGEPMLSSTMSKLEVSSRGEWVRLIPSLDGAMYRFDGESVEALPVTADTLLHTSFKFNEDTIFAGGKFSSILGILPQTGDIKYVCDSRGCPTKRSTAEANQVLVVKRVSQTVRAIDPKTGDERWNFSVGQHEVNVANTGCGSLYESPDLDANLPSLHFVLPQGLIIAMDKQSQVVWKQKLPSPIVDAWSLINNKLERLNLFSSSTVPALLPANPVDEVANGGGQSTEEGGQSQPALYIGIHEKMLYILQNGLFQKEVNSFLQRYISSHSANTQENRLPRVQWQPYSATATSRTPALAQGHQRHPLLLDYEKKEHTSDLVVAQSFDYKAFDNGYYLFGNEDSFTNNSHHWSSYDEDIKDFLKEDPTIANQFYYICFEAGPTAWKKLTVALLCYGALHYLLFRYMLRRAGHALQRRMNPVAVNVLINLLHGVFREDAQVRAIMQRIGLNIRPLPPPPPPSSGSPVEIERGSAPLEGAQRQDSNFSRFSNDFEVIERLGKGGFGVVLRVRNNLDENEYAVKRILLPSKESSREVTREVRALAKLNHQNIVRYYNSWIETSSEESGLPVEKLWWHSDTLSLSKEVEESEQISSSKKVITFSESKLSTFQFASGIVKKTNSSFEFPFEFDSESNLADDIAVENREFDSSQAESSDDDSVSGYDDDNEYNYNGNFDDESDDNIVFEDSSSAVPEPETEENEGGVLRSPLDVVHRSPHPPTTTDEQSNILTGSDFSKLTCTTVENRFHESSEGSSNGQVKRKKQPADICNKQARTVNDTQAIGIDNKQTLDSDNKQNLTNGNKQVYNTQARIKSASFSLTSQKLSPSSKPRRAKSLHSVKGRGLASANSATSNEQMAPKRPTSLGDPIPRTYLYIQMELCAKESLKDWLFENSERDPRYMYTMFNGIVNAVEYVHDGLLMHRDLKPSNIFFSLDGEIKIGDFGLVTTIGDENDTHTPVVDSSSSSANYDFLAKTQTKQRTLNVGTHLYMSPEQLSGQSYDYKVDIFSLGLILFEMLVHFSTQMERQEKMCEARNKKFPDHFNSEYPDVVSLLQLTLHEDPDKRPTTRGLRAREPLLTLQKGLENISPEEHFHLKPKTSYSRSSSSSMSRLQSSSSQN